MEPKENIATVHHGPRRVESKQRSPDVCCMDFRARLQMQQLLFSLMAPCQEGETESSLLGFPNQGSIVQSSPGCQLSRMLWSFLTSRSHLTCSFKASRTPRPWGHATNVLVDETQQRAGVGENGERSFLGNSRNGVDTMGPTSESLTSALRRAQVRKKSTGLLDAEVLGWSANLWVTHKEVQSWPHWVLKRVKTQPWVYLWVSDTWLMRARDVPLFQFRGKWLPDSFPC